MSSKEKAKATIPSQSMVEAAIRIGALALILYWCFMIFRPFLTVMVWSIIIAVAAYPVFKKVSKWFKGRKGLTATLMVLLAVGLILIPGITLTSSVIDTGKEITHGLEEGTLTVGPPNEQVKDWPLIGEQVYDFWSQTNASLERTLQEYNEQVKHAIGWLFTALAGIGLDILLTIVSLIIAGVLLVNADAGDLASKSFFTRLVGPEGEDFSNDARDTIRSVVQGVILVALIQSVMAWLGFVLAGVPAAGVWAILVLLLAIMQLPPLIIMLPIIVYVFSYASTGVAIAFAVWGIIVSGSDTFLKPMFLGRGLKIPMLVILIGAIGGMMLHGIIGLFIGAVVLALGYKLYISWMNNWEIDNPSTDN